MMLMSPPSSPSKTLNLRYRPISQELLSSPANQDVEKLWIGPSPKMCPALVVESLPSSLQYLDWDMTDTTSIQDEVLEKLFQKKSLRHLCLRFRGDKGAILLSKHLATASSLESLDLRGNHISDIGAQALAGALKQESSSLACLNLGYNRIGDDGIQALSQVLGQDSCTLQCLNLSCNAFGQEGAHYLALSLKTNSSLKQVSLFCNHISHAACVELACSLKHNFTLEQLKLGGTLTDTVSEIRLFIEYLLKLNRGGRNKLREQELPHEEWSTILSNAANDLDVLLFFVSNKPELVMSQ